ncbi:MAG: LytTR family transcriptional regulator [Chitinophagaceae bacterium]|nr:MAG: LytTR family transcriptional regulator [Chitinophagaceae bacterium]
MELKLNAIKQIASKRTFLLVGGSVFCFIVLTVLQDFLEAKFKNSSFYLSESFLFASFWWLFIPFLYAQFALSNWKNDSRLFKVLIILLPMVVHATAFPAVVWIISGLFYENTFRYLQTFQYSLSVHLYSLFLFYTVPILSYSLIKKRTQKKALNIYPQTFIVTEGSRHLSIAVADVLYFSANSPYINIHVGQKQYVYNESLRSIAEKIDPTNFVRIHKSTIVNIAKVESYTSRLNGDYDLTLHNGTILRVSRNFAATFKQRHRVTLK